MEENESRPDNWAPANQKIYAPGMSDKLKAEQEARAAKAPAAEKKEDKPKGTPQRASLLNVANLLVQCGLALQKIKEKPEDEDLEAEVLLTNRVIISQVRIALSKLQKRALPKVEVMLNRQGTI